MDLNARTAPQVQQSELEEEEETNGDRERSRLSNTMTTAIFV